MDKAVEKQCDKLIWSLVDILRSELSFEDPFRVIPFLLSLASNAELSSRCQEKYSFDLTYKTFLSNKTEFRFEENIYDKIIDSFGPLLKSISKRGLLKVNDVLCSNKDLFTELNYPILLDRSLYTLPNIDRRAGEFLFPQEVIDFIKSTVKLTKDSKIYNPFAGAASFAVKYPDQKYIGQEINHLVWAFGMLRILAYQLQDSHKLLLEDSITNWPEADKNFDLIISSPPFGLRLNHYAKEFSEYGKVDNFFISKGIESLSENGYLIVLIPISFLFNGGKDRKLREILIEKSLIETVISFPGGLLTNTSIPFAMLVLKKNPVNNSIRFIDAETCVEVDSRKNKILNGDSLYDLLYSQEEIKDKVKFATKKQVELNDYILNSTRYFLEEFDGVQLGEILKIERGSTEIPARGKVIRAKDLNNGVDFKFDINKLNEENLNKKDFRKISSQCLLVTTIGNKLKPTVLNPENTPVYIARSVTAFKINSSKIDNEFLIKELLSPKVFEQIQRLSQGSVISQIRASDILNLKIQLPTYELQRKEVEDFKSNEIEAFIQSLNAKFEINKQDVIEQNQFLRHSIAGPLSNLDGAIASIDQILVEKVAPKFNGLFTLKKSDRTIHTLEDYIKILKRDTDLIRKKLKGIINEKGEFNLDLIEIDMISFIKEYVNQKRANNVSYSIQLEIDDESLRNEETESDKIMIFGDKNSLTDLYDNIIENAIKHAFDEKSISNKIAIYISASDGQFYCLVSNTGNPLPEGFNIGMFEKKGSRMSDTDGDGYGGWYINQIIRAHNGELLDIIDERGPEGIHGEWVTSIEFEIPLTTTQL